MNTKVSAKSGIDRKTAMQKRGTLAIEKTRRRRETMVKGRREICPAADELYKQYGVAKAMGMDAVATWRADLIKAYQNCTTIILQECDPIEVGDLMDLLADIKLEQKPTPGGGKMVGGNITAHFIRLQRWLIQHLGTGLDSMSRCAKWFIDKILDGLSAIGRATVAGASIAFPVAMDLARTALGHNDTQTFQYLLAFCGMITSVASNAGEKVHDWLQRARAAAAAAATATGAAAGAAATATGAAVGAVAQPYIDVFTQNMIDLLTTQKDLFLGKIPGVNTPDEFDAWLKTLTMGDFMTATANIIAAGKWASVAIAGGQIAGGLVLTTGYYGILAAAWISDSYILTGTWLTYQVYSGLPVAQKESITEAFKAVDEYLAKGIGSPITKDLMDKIDHLKTEPIAKALVVARLQAEMTKATVKRDAAMGDQAHLAHVQTLTAELGDITAETTAIEEHIMNTQMNIDIQNAMRQAKAPGPNGAAVNGGAGAKPIVESDTPIAGSDVVNINTADSQTAAAGGAPKTGSGALQKIDAPGPGLGTPGGKRATRKRGKRSSKRGSRKTKTTRKKRRGKK